ncbi:hypothetical protein E1265_20910 [Streptomyces sp. 8K308]|nr:hypothetical protein E1265_20910 [Streptomyces sp. 8K308]
MDRISHTRIDLQDNGGNMETVVRALVRSMNHALETEEDVSQLIVGDGGLEEAYSRHLAAAVNEWNGWQSALEVEVNALPGREIADQLSIDRPIMPVTIRYRDQARQIYPASVSALQSVYALPESLATEIRERHLQNAADSAADTYTDIEETIKAYRRKLAEYGAELQGLRVDLSGGPLGLWTTEEMAEFSAARFLEELGEDEPDPRVLAMYSAGLEGITDAIYGDASNPGAPARDLTEDELAYLETFFAGIDDPEVLASLGNKIEGWDEAKRNIANGIAMLANPEIGGHDPATEEGRAALPETVRRFVYEYQEHGMFPPGPGMQTDGQRFIRELELFNGFGDIMSQGTLPAGDQLSKDMARVAVDVQQQATVQAGMNIHYTDYVKDTGSSALLTAASRNTEASAALLTDDDFRHDFLRTIWHDSYGAGDLVRAGTTLPEGVDINAPEAHQYVESAYHLLRDAGDYEKQISAAGYDEYEALAYNNVALQQSIADTTMAYMDFISHGIGNTTAFYASSDPDGDDPWTVQNLHGEDYLYSFELNGIEREELFRLMNRSDEGVRQSFFAAVGNWQEETAYQAFMRDNGNGEHDEAPTFRDIARIAGTVERIQTDDDVSDSSKQQYTAYGAISLGASVANTLIDFGKGNALTTGAAYAATEMLRYTLPDGNAAVQQAQWDAENFGDKPLKERVAQAAIRADYAGAGEDRGEIPEKGDQDFTPTNVFNAADRIGANRYAHYLTSMLDGYNDAIKRDSSGSGDGWSRPMQQ